jgi:low temperature requirement protein LtrA
LRALRAPRLIRLGIGRRPDLPDNAAFEPLARDVFSLLHFPMLCGVIAMAAATKEALAHPEQPLGMSIRVALGAGAALFVSGTSVAIWRATGRMPVWRGLLALTAAAAVISAGTVPWVALTALLVMFVAVSVIEHEEPA